MTLCWNDNLIFIFQDFGALMRSNMLVPLRRSSDDTECPAEKMRCRLERYTKYWPIIISNTMIFNLPRQVN